MGFPTPHTIEVRDRVDGALDAFGDEVVEWADWRPMGVMGWAPTTTTEPKTVGVDRVVVDLEVFSPATVTARSQVRLPDGRIFDVVGEPEDWNRGPFGYAPGYVFNLRRVDG